MYRAARQLHRSRGYIPRDCDHLTAAVYRGRCSNLPADRARPRGGLDDRVQQIVGRGTRVHEDSKKYYFTLIDFRKATNHFADPDFDGEPVQIYEPGENEPMTPPDDVPPPNDEGEALLPPEPGDDETLVDGYPLPDLTLSPRVAETPAKYYIKGKPVN